ncbi:hypothetical protein SUGI_0821410 [Cryptomeria japonica]|uniref:stigma-specific STIG1-like protein 1 n=1 Tax=Cryptomeria japonica TaxID=3369 RepID=UPI0024147A91|nr:stigma-specific STIG1-like protein 1 [Cryptomeria japonica]GLJ40103.1 hypothetical protein SUGI_0821410 [Cryptomeria japonica]
MVFKIRLSVSFLICLVLVVILLRNGGCECRELNSLDSHSMFLRRIYNSRGRKAEVLCGNDPGLCARYGSARGYSNGNWACCSKRYCIDVSSDPFNCGSCGHSCGYGLGCCGGKCTNFFSDNAHCGSCFNACHKEKCSFGMCGYAYGYGYPNFNQTRRIGY